MAISLEQREREVEAKKVRLHVLPLLQARLNLIQQFENKYHKGE